jgi:uncharacterized BrkB/YihY/UPF0761 family membrane protein
MIEYRKTKITGNRPVINKAIVVPNSINMPESLRNELNKIYRSNFRKERLTNIFKKFGIGAAIYVGLNIVLGLGIVIATVLGYDIIGWYTGLLGVN